MTMTQPMPSSSAEQVDETCLRCQLSPCACEHIANLRPGGRLDYLREVALAEFYKPFPHRGGCPCPKCYSRCLASWRTQSGRSR
jgi:hypothetical protein